MVLRHAPEKAGLTLTPEGWCDMAALVAAMQKKFIGTTVISIEQDIMGIVAEDAKGRFQILDGRIRAAQGHSVDGIVAVDLTPVKPPDILYHGTTQERWEKIKEHGFLTPMKRHHVHLSEEEETARSVGSRHRKETPIILHIDAKWMEEAGIEFYRSENNVWLTDSFPAEYVFKVTMTPAPKNSENGV